MGRHASSSGILLIYISERVHEYIALRNLIWPEIKKIHSKQFIRRDESLLGKDLGKELLPQPGEQNFQNSHTRSIDRSIINQSSIPEEFPSEITSPYRDPNNLRTEIDFLERENVRSCLRFPFYPYLLFRSRANRIIRLFSIDFDSFLPTFRSSWKQSFFFFFVNDFSQPATFNEDSVFFFFCLCSRSTISSFSWKRFLSLCFC